MLHEVESIFALANGHRGRLEHHERVLDLRTGVLERRLQWTSQADHTVRVRSRRLVSLDLRSVAGIAYEVEAVGQAPRIALQSNLIASQPQATPSKDPRAAAALADVLESRLAIAHDLRVVLAHRTRRSDLMLAAGMDHVIEHDGTRYTRSGRTGHGPGHDRRAARARPVAPGRQLLAYHWSQRGVDIPRRTMALKGQGPERSCLVPARCCGSSAVPARR